VHKPRLPGHLPPEAAGAAWPSADGSEDAADRGWARASGSPSRAWDRDQTAADSARDAGRPTLTGAAQGSRNCRFTETAARGGQEVGVGLLVGVARGDGVKGTVGCIGASFLSSGAH